jgi:predicted aspartyl protease
MRRTLSAALGVLFLTGAHASSAPSCNLTLVASLDLDPAQLPDRAVIQASIRDTPEKMIVDTGATQTMISEAMADQFQLHRIPISEHFVMTDYFGNRMDHVAVIPSLTTGNLHASDVHALIMPHDPGAAGVIGPDLLLHYEVELDFAARKMNLFEQDHCPGQVVYWTHDPVATVPLDIDLFGHIGLDVTLDGRTIPAHIDTGAPVSAMKWANAEADFGLTPKSPGMTKPPSPSDPGLFHQFKSLAIGGIQIANPSVYISGGMNAEGQPIKTDFLIGLRELSKLHVVISYKEKRLFATAPNAH